jgi:hypothetical protein
MENPHTLEPLQITLSRAEVAAHLEHVDGLVRQGLHPKGLSALPAYLCMMLGLESVPPAVNQAVAAAQRVFASTEPVALVISIGDAPSTLAVRVTVR